METGVNPTSILRIKILKLRNLARQQASTQWGVTHIRNIQGFEKVLFFIPIVWVPQRKFSLKGRDRMDCMGLFDGFRRRFTKPQITNLALCNQARHFTHCFFNRHFRVNSVQIIKVDVIGFQPFQTGLTTRTQIRWPCVGRFFTVGQSDVSKLTGNDGLLSLTLKCSG